MYGHMNVKFVEENFAAVYCRKRVKYYSLNVPLRTSSPKL